MVWWRRALTTGKPREDVTKPVADYLFGWARLYFMGPDIGGEGGGVNEHIIQQNESEILIR